MSFARLVLDSLLFYRSTHVATALGVGTAVGVLAGALLVGSSVRQSLATIATNRLGHADVVVSAERPFAEALGDRLVSKRSPSDHRAEGLPFAPLLALEGLAQHGTTGR